MSIESEIAEIVAWIEIERISTRILSLPPRSTTREILRRELCELMRLKIERELVAA